MFAWFWKWRRARHIRRSRLLFEFWDGNRFRSVDPWLAYRTLRDDEKFSFENDWEFANDGHQPETDYFVVAMHAAFGVTRYDDRKQTGLTEPEMLDLAEDLFFFLGALKKNGGTSSMPAEPSATSPSPPNSEESSPTATEPSSPPPPTTTSSESKTDAEPQSPVPSATP